MKIGPFKFSFRRLGIILLLGIVLMLVMNFNTRLGEMTRLQNQVATVRVQATGVMITQQVLETQVGVATSDAAVEAYARGEAHMVKPGDNPVVVVPDPGATPPPKPAPTAAVNDLSNWQLWMLFIFGK